MVAIPQNEDEVRADVWRGQRAYDLIGAFGRYIGPVGITTMGTAVAYGYAETGRLDLLVGGSLLALLGAGIADISSGRNFLSRAFNKVTGNLLKITQPMVLAAAGIGASLILGGGEVMNYLDHHGLTLTQVWNDRENWAQFWKSASYPKTVANLAWFLAASALDIPVVNRAARKILDPDNVINAQNALGFIGSYTIFEFATRAELPLYLATASLQMTTCLAAMAAWLHGKMNPAYFDDMHGLTAAEYSEKMEGLEERGLYNLFREEQRKMLLARGHITPRQFEQMSSRIPVPGYAPNEKMDLQ